ncbi:glycosyl hydrolase 53 family protein [Balneolaceae bacterium ANBcel3]|nr:glycosyl hydrolase 53 family protein [Balneolaceae bacterium ANBcel3]
MKGTLSLLFIILFTGALHGQSSRDSFYFGHDLSYVNQMEDCGARFSHGGIDRDPFELFSEHGSNLIRARLWMDPSWWQQPLSQPEGVKPFYSDLEDVKQTFKRAREHGMELMLDIHYSDIWADPGRQIIPKAWRDVAYNDEALADSVYNYTYRVLSHLEEAGLTPEFVKIGNETNPGILLHLPEQYSADPELFEPAEQVAEDNDFERNALLFNAAIRAVRDIGTHAGINPAIVLHWSNLEGVGWWYDRMIDVGVTDFDVIGFSYYYAWHGGSIQELESVTGHLVNTFPEYEVMVVETGYLWSEDYGGIINTPDPQYAPVIPEKQREYMVDFTRAVMRGGGKGVIFWEPAWVDTPCTTPWGVGSSHTHVSFFDPISHDFMENGGGTWPYRSFYKDPEWPKVKFKVDMSGVDVSEKEVFIRGSFTDPVAQKDPIPMADEGEGIFSWFSYLPPGKSGTFYFLKGNDPEVREKIPEACADESLSDRVFRITDEEVNEFSYRWGTCEPAGVLSGTKEGVRLPEESWLWQNYPNPFNPVTRIGYEIHQAGHVYLRVFTISGQKVDTLVNSHRSPGRYTVEFDGSTLSSGAYFYVLQVGETSFSRHMTLIK